MNRQPGNTGGASDERPGITPARGFILVRKGHAYVKLYKINSKSLQCGTKRGIMYKNRVKG